MTEPEYPEYIILGPIAYEGRDDCVDVRCRRFFTGHEITPGCIGWHCTVCDEPSSQYGHKECRDEQ